MNNYMILGKVLKCHTLKPHLSNPFTFREMRKKTRFVNWKKIFVMQRNKVPTVSYRRSASQKP